MNEETVNSGSTAANDNAPPPASFEQQIARLEQIVAKLEHGDAPLAESLTLFEEGTRLAASCSQMLDQAEQKVVRLMKGPDGAPVELPFEDTDPAEGSV